MPARGIAPGADPFSRGATAGVRRRRSPAKFDEVRRRSGRVSAQIRPGRQGEAVHVVLDEPVVEHAVCPPTKEDDDDDFVDPPQPNNSVQHESRKRRTTVCPPTQEDDDDDDDDFVDPPLQQLRTRFPTKRLTDFVSGLNNTQKACLNSIGFGSVLKLKIDTFSKSLAFWVVDNYNPDTNSICFYNKTIKVTKERVNEIYGIPMGDEEMKLLSDRESKELEMGGYGNATVSTTDLIASSSRQAQDTDEAVLEGNESEFGDVDEQARKLEEIDFNFKEVAKANKNLKRLLELGVKEYSESKELKERITKNISDKTPIHDPSHTSVKTPRGQDSIPKENNADKEKQIINEGCVEGAEEGDEEDSVPTMTQLLTPVVFDNLLADALAKRSGSRSLQLGFKIPEVVLMMQDVSDVNDDEIIDVMPLRYIPASHAKRVIKPTAKAKSSYVKRVVDSCAQMQDVKMRVSGWFFSGMDSQWDVIYQNKFNDSGFKGVFESM
ncbi:hypothetical protein LXL04_031169 [Taraxacum kok-saghyz]